MIVLTCHRAYEEDSSNDSDDDDDDDDVGDDDDSGDLIGCRGEPPGSEERGGRKGRERGDGLLEGGLEGVGGWIRRNRRVLNGGL